MNLLASARVFHEKFVNKIFRPNEGLKRFIWTNKRIVLPYRFVAKGFHDIENYCLDKYKIIA